MRSINFIWHYLDVLTKVFHSSMVACFFQMVVKPSQQDFFRWESHQVFQCLSLPQQTGQARYICQCDVCKQTNLIFQINKVIVIDRFKKKGLATWAVSWTHCINIRTDSPVNNLAEHNELPQASSSTFSKLTFGDLKSFYESKSPSSTNVTSWYMLQKSM